VRTLLSAGHQRGFLPGETIFNRDLSWLDFNERVLSEAADVSVPPLERLRFAAIVSSNLDEFFMVRVAEIARLARRFPNRKSPDGLTASNLLTQIRERVLRQKSRQAVVVDEIFGELNRHGIHIYSRLDAHRTLDLEIRKRLPKIKSVIRHSKDPFPLLESERIHVFIRFPGEYAILTIQGREERLISLHSAKRSLRFALAERWLCVKAPELFPGKKVIEAFSFKMIREADLRYRPDDEDSLEYQIEEAVKRRSSAKVVRLELDASAYTEGALFLATALGLDSAALYRFDLPLDLRVLTQVYRVPGFHNLRYPSVAPLIPKPLRRRGIFTGIASHDILLHHPYDSFDIVVNFLRAAADDPLTTHIYHTVYRVGARSSVMEALQRAAKKGKRVTAYVEVKARFDEINNVRWAEELRRSGVRVVRPFGNLKVHSKLTQVVRQEPGGPISYLHLGTGNYHSGTARQYADLGIFTADKSLAQEVHSYFSVLARRSIPARFKELLVAPRNLHSRVLKLIHAEIAIQKNGGHGRIIAKVNSLVDLDIIEALYQASEAGVRVDLMVRGICCLRPGIPGLSERIRVISIVDRFLEHSRIYYFRAGGKEELYLSSADWMPRNFYTRMEIAFPVKDPALKRYIVGVILANGLQDNVKSWTLQADGSYAKSSLPDLNRQVRSQSIFTALAQKDYRDTALEHRVKHQESPRVGRHL
jgi:polyphosphate kinase